MPTATCTQADWIPGAYDPAICCIQAKDVSNQLLPAEEGLVGLAVAPSLVGLVQGLKH